MSTILISKIKMKIKKYEELLYILLIEHPNQVNLIEYVLYNIEKLIKKLR